MTALEHYDRLGNPIDDLTWSRLHSDPAYMVVEQTECEGITVSTVWLGIDHNFFNPGPPLIFETMIFGGPLDEACRRYSTEDEAKEGHKQAIQAVNDALNGKEVDF